MHIIREMDTIPTIGLVNKKSFKLIFTKNPSASDLFDLPTLVLSGSLIPRLESPS
jgi:hypothetical protein